MNQQLGLVPHRGTLILVLGILSLVICAFLGPFAWVMGKGDLARIDAGQMDPEGRGTTQGGMICGIIGTVLMVLGLVWFVFIMLAVGGAVMSGEI